MATQYGYRLFAVSLYSRNSRKKMNFGKAKLGSGDNEIDFIESLNRICAAIVGTTTTEVLRYRDKSEEDLAKLAEAADGDVEDTTPFLRLISYTIEGRRVDFEFKFGRRGSHDLAMSAEPDSDAFLEDKAPSNSFRACFYIPEDGETAILVAEVRNRLCPGEDLLRLIGVSSKHQEAERKEDAQIGWWRFTHNKISDPNRWDDFIEQGQAKGVSFLRYDVRPDGTRGDKAVTLRQDGLPAEFLGLAKTTVLGWIGKRSKNELKAAGVDTSKSTPQQLAVFLEVDVDPDEYQEAGLAWEGPDGSTSFISPEHIRDMFTYRIGQRGVLPTHTELRHAAEITLSDLLPVLGVEIDL